MTDVAIIGAGKSKIRESELRQTYRHICNWLACLQQVRTGGTDLRCALLHGTQAEAT
jgi:hypothetical protein